MSKEEDIKQIELTIESAQEAVAMRDALRRLVRNPDYDKIINSEYFQNEPARLVLTKAEPAMDTPEKQKAIMHSIDAIGHFRQYLQSIMQVGRMAEQSIEDNENERSLILESDEE